MKIGIAFDLKEASAITDGPDDLQEEFDHPATIAAIADALRLRGHTVIELGDGRGLVEKLLADRPDLVFNIAEGVGQSRSREARVPAVCELLGIPYTHSDPLALAVALDKDLTRRLVESHEVLVPEGIVVTMPAGRYDGDYQDLLQIFDQSGLNLPVIAKPVSEGSSKGIHRHCLIRRREDFGPVLAQLGNDYHQPILVEEFIEGDEVTVGILGGAEPRVLGVMKIIPKTPTESFVYSLEVKRDFRRLVDYQCPVDYPVDTRLAIETAALAAYEILGCQDVARVDFRVRDGVPFFLEINPLPGLDPSSSDLVIMAGLLGISHAQLVGMILEEALQRLGIPEHPAS